MVSARQLRAAELSKRAIERRLGKDLLHDQGRGVYAVGYPRRDDLARAWRAVLQYPRTALCQRSSAWGHGMRTELGGPIHLASLTNRRDTGGVKVHWVTDLEVEVRKGLPCTTLPRTFLDLATVCRPDELANLIDRAEELRIFDLAPILPLLSERRGSPALRTALELHRAQSGGTQSELERRFKQLIIESGLPVPAHGRMIGDFWIDAIHEDERIAIELDGSTHLTRRSKQRDTRRDAWLVRHGWRPIRFTWFDVVHDPAHVVATLRALL